MDLVRVRPGHACPAMPSLVVLLGAKATIADLGIARGGLSTSTSAAHVRRGGSVLGLCGGYQMLGRAIHDPRGLEGPARHRRGPRPAERGDGLAADKRLEPAHGATGDGIPVLGLRDAYGCDRGAGPDASVCLSRRRLVRGRDFTRRTW